MKVSVFGLGYVGAVSVGCLAKLGHEVIGVDAVDEKISKVNDGRSPVVEPGLDDLISNGVSIGAIRATDSAEEAVHHTDISLVCVGTPSHRDGSLNMEYVERVCRQLGGAIRNKGAHHTIAVRSTVLPGFANVHGLANIEETSGLRNGAGFSFGVNPEFLREGTAVNDFFDPPFILIGADLIEARDRISALYSGVDAPLVQLDVNTASMIKYVCNAFHALKVTFANEVGSMCRALGIDSYDVMDVVCQDTKLNISPAYLKPGFAFGGSCLPKDLRALTDIARQHTHQIPTLQSLMVSNDLQIRRFVDEVLEIKRKRIAVLGLAFKEGTDDLRESPLVTVVESLLGKGCEMKVVDRNVALSKLIGANKRYIEQEIPHIASMLTDDLHAAVAESDVVIIGNKDPAFREVVEKCGGHATVFDLVRMFGRGAKPGREYRGIAW